MISQGHSLLHVLLLIVSEMTAGETEREKKDKKTSADRKERRIIHFVILFMLMLLTFFRYMYTAF